MSEPARTPVQIGEILAGKYRVDRILGTGGVGIVVAAMHADLHELRAIKLLLPSSSVKPSTVERFLRGPGGRPAEERARRARARRRQARER